MRRIRRRKAVFMPMFPYRLVALAGALLLVAPQAPVIAGERATLQVEPADSLADTPYRVLVRDARPGARIVLTARFQDRQPEPQTWTAIGTYRADRRGRLDTATASSIDGTYSGVVPGGLACTALPVPPAELDAYMEGGLRPRRPSFKGAESYSVEVTATVDGTPLAPLTIERRLKASGLTEVEVDDGAVQGVYIEPATPARGIPVLVVGGSEGGVPRSGAIRMASRGHPALAIAYFNYKNLSPTLTDIPVEVFGEGAAWLARRTGVERVALMGTSRGSEAVQLAAAHFPEHVAGVIAFVPSPVVVGPFEPDLRNVPSWRVGGQPVPQLPVPDAYSGPAIEKPPGLDGSAVLLPAWKDPAAFRAAATPLERIDAPMLVIGAGADAMWPSGYGAQAIADRMAALGKRRLVELHVYPDAGHGISAIGSANRMTHFLYHSVAKMWLLSGGTAEANCQASFDSWAAINRFLDRLAVPGSTVPQGTGDGR